MRWFFTNACRTSIIPTIVGLLSGGLMSGGVSAQESTFPSRLIQIVAPFPAGGSADFFARVMADKLSAITGRRVIVEPKPGASGIIGTRAVISSAPDGYTLLSTSVASILVPPNLIEPRPFDPLKDVAPITPMAKVPALLVAHPKLGVQTLPELVKYVKANPGKVNIANSGTGTVAHLAAELLKREAKIDIVHVAYRGAPPAVNDLLGGHAQLMFSDAAFFLEHIRTGRLVALAVGTTERIPSLPDVPTTAEVGYPSLLADNTYALFAPAGTPPDIIQKLNELVLTALSDPAVKQAYANQSATTAGMKVDAFKGLLQEQAARWIPLAKDAAAEAK